MTHRGRSNTSRRGFTLLEVILAAAMGSVILIACVAVFSALDRSDVLLEARAEQSGDLQRLRLVMQRTFMRVVTSDAPRPVPDDGKNPNVRRPSSANPDAPPPPPRLILQPSKISRVALMNSEKGAALVPQRLEVVVLESPVPTEKLDEVEELLAGRTRGRDRRDREKTSMFEKGGQSAFSKPGTAGSSKGNDAAGASGATSGGKSGGSGLGARSLEMSTLGAGGSGKGGDAMSAAIEAAKKSASGFNGAAANGNDPANDGSAAEDDEEATVRCMRGAFELRPQELTPRQRAMLERRGLSGVTAWEMWWVPLPPRVPEGAQVSETFLRRPLDEPTLIASNLRSVSWRLFDDRKQVSTAAVIWQADLPAYALMDVETTAGLKAEWLFEVDWAVGSEVPGRNNAQRGTGIRDAAKAVPVSGDAPFSPTNKGKP